MVGNSQSNSLEKLFLNALPFSYPAEPVTFYFSDHDVENIPLTPLKSEQLLTAEILGLFPSLRLGQVIYTSFTRKLEGFKPLAIDFNNPDNYYLVKRYYNREIKHFFKIRNRITDTTFVNDTQIWLRTKEQPKKAIKHCAYYDRFTLKVSYDVYRKTPLLVISYDNPAKVWKTTVQSLLDTYNGAADDPFSESGPSPLGMLKRVLVHETLNKEENIRRFTITRYDKIRSNEFPGSGVDLKNVFPIVNNELAHYLGFESEEEDNPWEKANRYTKNLPKIEWFVKEFIATDEFRKIMPVGEDFVSVEAGQVDRNSKNLLFAGNRTGVIPRKCLDNGPLKGPDATNIKLMLIAHESQKELALAINKYLHEGYGSFKGLPTYLGIDYTNKKGILFKSDSPFDEIKAALEERLKGSDNSERIIALYLTPISKNTKSYEDRLTYYKVKELLLHHGIELQCVEADKAMQVLNKDKAKNTTYFGFTLQNMAIAINAKLGGTPWRIAVPAKRELVVGVGAFKNTHTGAKYIGSAFSFDNTGSFNSFEYFQQNELDELAGSISTAVRRFRNTIENPSRLIIHYYKDMREEEVQRIEEELNNLDLDIPIYIVTINKTESEDIFVFDRQCDDRMPYSGRFVNLGGCKYLLCNNTRYEGSYSKPESYPFPVKLKIWSPNDPDSLDQQTIQGLIDQVYQFSRIYWKSVSQQNLPVTTKYPEMVAEIAPYFTDQTFLSDNDSNTLWFL